MCEVCPRPSAAARVRSAFALPMIALVWAYRLTLRPLLGGQCRFAPSCSQYALDALHAHGPWRGGWLTIRRLARCHPWGGSGVDPVPDQIPARGR